MSGKSPWLVFCEECGAVAEAYQRMMKEANFGGVLDEKTRLLILIGIYSTTRDPIAQRHFVEEAIKAGASKEEIKAAALLAFSTGISSAEMSMPIIQDAFRER